MMSTLRLSFFTGAGLCFASLLIAYFFMERYLLLEPCPLCILDRLVVLVMGIYFMLSAFVSTRVRWILWGGNVLTLGAGFVVAGRHVWQQHQPPSEVANCLSDSVVGSGLTDLIRKAFAAEGDCGAIYWELMGFSIPEQVLVLFSFLALLLLAQMFWMRR